MATQHVLMSVCDKCHKEAQTPFNKNPKNRKAKYLLPKGWLHVSGNTKDLTVFEIDLCADCAIEVRKAAGAFV